MERVNVFVNAPVGEEAMRRITAVSPRIKLTDGSPLMGAERRGDAGAKEKIDALLAHTEVIFGGIPGNFHTRSPGLKWIQLISAGVNMFLDDEAVHHPVKITNVRGVMSTPIAECVFQFMLMFAKEAPAYYQMKQEKVWKRLTPATLHGKTVGVVGLGSIGQEVARLARAFGMKVVATRRSAKPGEKARYVDIMLPSSQLKRLMAESDYVVIAIPLTRETTKLIGEEELRSMKRTAYIINIARGDVIDEDALIRTLEEKRIAGAGLDVTTIEPLPPGSRLWELPNVILSPHIAGFFEERVEQAVDVFLENLKRYLDGKRLVNMVDKKKGY